MDKLALMQFAQATEIFPVVEQSLALLPDSIRAGCLQLAFIYLHKVSEGDATVQDSVKPWAFKCVALAIDILCSKPHDSEQVTAGRYSVLCSLISFSFRFSFC